MNNPTPRQILVFRLRLRQSTSDAAALVHASARAWQQWESGVRKMPPATWELYLLKTGRHPELALTCEEYFMAGDQ